MMVAACGNESCAGAITLRQREAQHAAVEAERTLKIGDLEMHVPDADLWMDWLVIHRGLLLQKMNSNAQPQIHELLAGNQGKGMYSMSGLFWLRPARK